MAYDLYSYFSASLIVTVTAIRLLLILCPSPSQHLLCFSWLFIAYLQLCLRKHLPLNPTVSLQLSVCRESLGMLHQIKLRYNPKYTSAVSSSTYLPKYLMTAARLHSSCEAQHCNLKLNKRLGCLSVTYSQPRKTISWFSNFINCLSSSSCSAEPGTWSTVTWAWVLWAKNFCIGRDVEMKGML